MINPSSNTKTKLISDPVGHNSQLGSNQRNSAICWLCVCLLQVLGLQFDYHRIKTVGLWVLTDARGKRSWTLLLYYTHPAKGV